MDQKIRELYKKINYIGYYVTYHQNTQYMKMAKSLIPEINDFINWFLEKNKFGISKKEYDLLCRNLIEIVKDITEALKQEDRVLMMDALEQGISEYIKMILFPKSEEQVKDEKLV